MRGGRLLLVPSFRCLARLLCQPTCASHVRRRLPTTAATEPFTAAHAAVACADKLTPWLVAEKLGQYETAHLLGIHGGAVVRAPSRERLAV